MLVQEPVQAVIWNCLNHYAFHDATFLAERLLAEVNSDEALHLVATSYYRSGKPGRAYAVLSAHGLHSPQLKYLMARCCYDLGKLDECESSLTGNSVIITRTVDDLCSEYGSLSCFVLQLLGLVCSQTERRQKSSELLRRSLKLNPFLWHSYVQLCHLGERVDPNKVFRSDAGDSSPQHCLGQTLYTITQQMSGVNHSSGIGIPETPTSQVLSPVMETQPLTQQSTNTMSVIPPPSLISPTVPQTPSSIYSCLTPATLNTPVVGGVTVTPVFSETLDISSVGIPNKKKKAVCFRRVFCGLSNLTPITPSFGILPLENSSGGTTDPRLGGGGTSLAFLTPTPLPLSPLLLSQEVKPPNNNNNNNKNRILLRGGNNKESGHVQTLAKSHVFGTNCGNANPFQSPPTGHTNVRRSSRLFGNNPNNNNGNNNSSVKENNKQQRFVQPKSPARRGKVRGVGANNNNNNKGPTTLTQLNEKNNKNENMSQLSLSDLITPEPVVPTKKSAGGPGGGGNLVGDVSGRLVGLTLAQQASALQKQSVCGLLSLMKDIGSAYLQLSQYNCTKALNQLSLIPPQHYHTAWIQALVGRAHFEMNNYTAAVKAFSEARQREPELVYSTEYYSTSLWHLQKEASLSALAQDLVLQDPQSPEAWCAAGNCFSLQKEHDAAIRFFSRAIQVDSNFAYAYTLLGHEHIATEELDRALRCYRSAVRIDPRHYNAWYGIGLVLFKQECFSQSESYFKKALAIHPNSSVLMCHVAVVEHALQKSISALATLDRALDMEPLNPLCKYHRASVLHMCDRHEEALQELLQLKDIVPKESNVYFLLGKVYKKLGQTHQALMNFSWAMDLDPKGSNNQFKENIDPPMSGFNQSATNTDNEDTLSYIEPNQQQSFNNYVNGESVAGENNSTLNVEEESLILEDDSIPDDVANNSGNGASLVEEQQQRQRQDDDAASSSVIPIMESLSDDSL